jgi:hypothetical protein
MPKQTKLTDAEKLQCFDAIRNSGDALRTMTAAELAAVLSTVIHRPVSPEIARHQAKVCGVELNVRRSTSNAVDSVVLRDVLVGMHAVLEILCDSHDVREATWSRIRDLRVNMQKLN